MYEYYFTFRSLTLAQRAALELTRHGLAAELLRAPMAISDLGCTYAVRVRQNDGAAAAAILVSAGIPFEKQLTLHTRSGLGEGRL